MTENSAFLGKSEQALLDLLANNLFGAGESIDYDDLDWDRVWHEAYLQAVPLIAFSYDFTDKIDDKIANHIKNSLNTIISLNSRRIGEHVYLHNILSKENIKYTIIKGFACSLYYPDPMLRSIGDVDFLVKHNDLEKTERVLIKNGFLPLESTSECHKVFTFKGCRYEMHYEPAGIPTGEAGDVLQQYLNDAVDCSVINETEFGAMCVPSDFHHGLIILLHMCHHLNCEGIGLRHLCDWAVFISSLSRESFRDLFEEKLKATGLWLFASILTQICVDFLGCSSGILFTEENKELSESVLSDIFSSGNFGQKSDDRAHEALLLSSEKTAADQNSHFIRNLFFSANRIVFKNWKISRKLKILLPFGWLFFGVRYFIRSLLGKRPQINISKIKSEANERKNLYAKLRLFEINKTTKKS